MNENKGCCNWALAPETSSWELLIIYERFNSYELN